MKTLLAIFCTIVGLVGLARATPFDWSQAQTLTLTRNEEAQRGFYTASDFRVDGTKDFAIKVNVSFSGREDAAYMDENGTTMALISLGDGGQDFTLFRNGKNGKLSVYAKGPNSTALDGTFLFVPDYEAGEATAKDPVSATIVLAYSAADLRMDVWLNGAQVATMPSGKLPTGGFSSELDFLCFGASTASGNESWSIMRNDTWAVDSILVSTTLLPEPTTFALLALGVAALALRRRNAP